LTTGYDKFLAGKTLGVLTAAWKMLVKFRLAVNAEE
jgi:hypothetical protein